jgi:hypothetical protein
MTDLDKLKAVFDDIGVEYENIQEHSEITKEKITDLIQVGSYSGIDRVYFEFFPNGKLRTIS